MRKRPYIQRKNNDIFFGYTSFKGTILPLLILIILIVGLTYLNCKIR